MKTFACCQCAAAGEQLALTRCRGCLLVASSTNVNGFPQCTTASTTCNARIQYPGRIQRFRLLVLGLRRPGLTVPAERRFTQGSRSSRAPKSQCAREPHRESVPKVRLVPHNPTEAGLLLAKSISTSPALVACKQISHSYLTCPGDGTRARIREAYDDRFWNRFLLTLSALGHMRE